MELDQNFKEFLGLLNEHQVEYLVVGGYSVAYHGFPRYTGDIDVWINPKKANAERLLLVLEAFGFGTMGLTVSDFIYPDKVIQFGIEPIRIDVMTAISGIGNFEDAYKNRKENQYDDITVHFIGLQDLLKNKKSTNRLQDQRDIQELNKIHKI